jgi:hypothetical protein
VVSYKCKEEPNDASGDQPYASSSNDLKDMDTAVDTSIRIGRGFDRRSYLNCRRSLGGMMTPLSSGSARVDCGEPNACQGRVKQTPRLSKYQMP